MHPLCLTDSEAAETFMFFRLTLYVVLQPGISYVMLVSRTCVALTPMGFAAVRIARDSSLKVSDMAWMLFRQGDFGCLDPDTSGQIIGEHNRGKEPDPTISCLEEVCFCDSVVQRP